MPIFWYTELILCKDEIISGEMGKIQKDLSGPMISKILPCVEEHA